MSRLTPRRRKGHGEIVPPSSKLDRIGELLKIQVETFPPKELTAEEVERWETDLDVYPTDAIEYAFENWRRNGHFFPVPSDIRSLCESFQPRKSDFKAEEYRHHGMGHVHILALWDRVSKRVNDFRERGEEYRSLTHDEITMLLKEVSDIGKSVA